MSLIIPYLGKYPTIADECFIADNVNIIGNVSIGKKSSIWFNSVIRGDVSKIEIGNKTNIQDGTIIHVSKNGGNSFIGDNVTIGHKAVIHACHLENNCFIGMASIILDGAIVQTNAMLAAGSLLTQNKIVPSGELWAGAPAKFMRKLTENEIKNINDSADHYWRLAENYLGYN